MNIFKVVVEAVRGHEMKGYIALDDFVISQKENCEIKPSDATPTTPKPETTPTHTGNPHCNFEVDWCNWEVVEVPWKWQRYLLLNFL